MLLEVQVLSRVESMCLVLIFAQSFLPVKYFLVLPIDEKTTRECVTLMSDDIMFHRRSVIHRLNRFIELLQPSMLGIEICSVCRRCQFSICFHLFLRLHWNGQTYHLRVWSF